MFEKRIKIEQFLNQQITVSFSLEQKKYIKQISNHI